MAVKIKPEPIVEIDYEPDWWTIPHYLKPPYPLEALKLGIIIAVRKSIPHVRFDDLSVEVRENQAVVTIRPDPLIHTEIKERVFDIKNIRNINEFRLIIRSGVSFPRYSNSEYI